jgi:hypothetical protein
MTISTLVITFRFFFASYYIASDDIPLTWNWDRSVKTDN